MSGLILTRGTAPSVPSSSKGIVYLDSADGRLKVIHGDGTTDVVSHRSVRNAIVNSGFWYAQRQTPGTLTTYSNTTGRTYGPDRFGLTNENASVQFARADTAGAPEVGLSSRFYGRFLKLTSAGKVIISQVITGTETMPYRGRRVHVQFRAKNAVGSHVLRLALLQLTAAGTINTIPGTFVSAFGAVGTDPKWGTNLSAITPVLAEDNSTISGAGLSSTLTSAWRRYGGVFTVPSDCKNLVLAIFTNGQPAANDEFDLGEIGLYDGDEERDFAPETEDDELGRCQRHCWKTFQLDQVPAQALGNASGEQRWPALIAGTSIQRSMTVCFPRVMFGVPTLTIYNPNTASAQARDQNANADCTSTTANNITERGFNILATGAAGTAVGNLIAAHILAEAEL